MLRKEIPGLAVLSLLTSNYKQNITLLHSTIYPLEVDKSKITTEASE